MCCAVRHMQKEKNELIEHIHIHQVSLYFFVFRGDVDHGFDTLRTSMCCVDDRLGNVPKWIETAFRFFFSILDDLLYLFLHWRTEELIKNAHLKTFIFAVTLGHYRSVELPTTVMLATVFLLQPQSLTCILE